MKKFVIKFLREFEVEVQADSGDMASQIATSVLAQFPKGSCKLLSIVAEDAVIEVLAEIGGGTGRKPKPRGGPPNLGGNPGGTVVKLPVLVDQIAEAA